MTRATQRHLGLEEGVDVWLTTTNGAHTQPVIHAVSG